MRLSTRLFALLLFIFAALVTLSATLGVEMTPPPI
jgi:hypothetical protein